MVYLLTCLGPYLWEFAVIAHFSLKSLSVMTFMVKLEVSVCSASECLK